MSLLTRRNSLSQSALPQTDKRSREQALPPQPLRHQENHQRWAGGGKTKPLGKEEDCWHSFIRKHRRREVLGGDRARACVPDLCQHLRSTPNPPTPRTQLLLKSCILLAVPKLPAGTGIITFNEQQHLRCSGAFDRKTGGRPPCGLYGGSGWAALGHTRVADCPGKAIPSTSEGARNLVLRDPSFEHRLCPFFGCELGPVMWPLWHAFHYL